MLVNWHSLQVKYQVKCVYNNLIDKHTTHDMSGKYRIDPALRIALRELGLSPVNIIRRACLPGDLFTRDVPMVSAEEFFRLWQAIGDEAGNETIAIDLGKLGANEGFSPGQMAALASPNLIIAAKRLAHYKSLFAPIFLDIDIQENQVTISSGAKGYALPMTLAVTEIIFWAAFVCRATREHITPIHATLPQYPVTSAPIEEALGVRISSGTLTSVTFNLNDARRPFLTSDADAWRFYEPVLDNRLSEMERNVATADRVHSALVEILPGGRTSLEEVSASLAYSPRSLQRLLRREGTTFKQVLAQTRARLAKHYLCASNIPHAEVAFLLGYDDPNSFFRAFRSWTGTTPERFRLDNQIT